MYQMSKINFKDLVFESVKLIPPGYVSTYSEIAKYIDKNGAYQAIGQVLKNNPNAIGGRLPMIPCHRVIKSNGEVGGFRGSPDSLEKCEILQREGVQIINGKVIDKKYYFKMDVPYF